MSIADKLTTIAENEQKIYDKGRTDEWSDFWDFMQNYGKRTKYDYAFYMEYTDANTKGDNAWNDETFKPKYDIKPTTANRAFRGATFTDFVGICERQEIVFDTSNCTVTALLFQQCYYNKRLPIIDLSKTTSRTTMFSYNYRLETIEGLIFKNDDTVSNAEMFYNCHDLKNLTILGGSFGSSVNLSWSPLSVESMKSIITHMMNHSGTDKEGVYKLTLSGTCWETLEASGKPFDDGLTSDETLTWQDYVTSVLGWLV